MTANDVKRIWPDLSDEEASEVAEAVNRYGPKPKPGKPRPVPWIPSPGRPRPGR